MPALALADALCAVRPEVEPVLVGAERGIEAELLPSKPFRYHLLPFEPIYRSQWWRNARWPLLLGRVWKAGVRVLEAEQPAVAIGTGGYVSGPILFQAHRRGIPLVLQEQNVYPGIATRWLARHARQLHLGFPEARAHLKPGSETEVCQFGNPIVPPPDPLPDQAASRERLGIPADARVMLVMGGSQGARAVNRAVATALDQGLLARVYLLWSTGPRHWESLRHYDARPLRQVRPFWDPIAEAYAAADLTVARAGAMTIAGLTAWGQPSILVPLPSAAGDHQARNADAMALSGAALHLPEASLNGPGLARLVEEVLGDPGRLTEMSRAARARGNPKAAETIARTILTLVS